MRIAWFTPFSARSAVAHYSRVVVEALMERAEVHIFLPSGTAGEELSTRATIVRYTAEDLPRQLAAYDCGIFNMGDSAYHFATWQALCAAHDAMHPTLAILHDIYYLNFFHAFAQAAHCHDALRDWLDAAYGAPGRALLTSPAAAGDLQRYPLYQPILERADAVIVHSLFCRERVGLASDDDVLELFIPVEYARAGVGREAVERGSGERALVLGMGVGTPNKNLHLVLEALASDARLAREVEFCFVGAVAAGYLDELRALVDRRRLDHVRFPGYLPQAELHALLARADVCVNLRRPCLEGGSASLVEMLAAGKPVVVYDDGVYADLPDECVCKVPPAATARDLAQALRALVGDAPRRQRMGEAAAQLAHSWTVARYADALLAFLAQRREPWAVQRATRDGARRAATELRQIGAGSSAHVRTVVDALACWAIAGEC